MSIRGWGRGSKYRNIRVTIDGVRFDSKKEARWYSQLQIRERLGEIRNLQRQVRYPLIVNHKRVGAFVADAVYEERRAGVWVRVIADLKSPATRTNRLYRLKKKMMDAMGFPVTEVL